MKQHACIPRRIWEPYRFDKMSKWATTLNMATGRTMFRSRTTSNFEVVAMSTSPGGTGDLRGQEIPDQLSAASPDRLWPVSGVLLEISELVHVDCVTDAKRDRENLRFW